MINVSDTFKQKLQDGERVWQEVEITFPDGTVKTVKNEIMGENCTFSDCAESSGFPIGCVVCKSMTLELDNTSDQWKNYNFYMAKVHAYLKMQTSVASPATTDELLDENYDPILDQSGGAILATKAATEDRIETIDKGIYTITTPEQYGEILSFTALDDMYKANATYTSKLVLPQTIINLVRDACDTLSIPFGGTMQHGNLIISEIPENMTFRQLFGWAAMLETANARLDSRGYLRFIKWDFSNVQEDYGAIADADGNITFKGGANVDSDNFISPVGNWSIDNDGFLTLIESATDTSEKLKDFFTSPTVSSDDIIITGIKLKNRENEAMYGSTGYVLELENDLVADSDLDTVAAQIGDSIIGAKFRNMSGELAYNPLIEFGDMAYTYDRKWNRYITPLTDVSCFVNGKTTVKTQADDPIRGMSKFVSDGTKAIVEARRLVKKEQSAREKAVKKLEETLKNSSGLYETSVAQEDGSTITYLHDKPTLAESKNVIKFTAEAIGVSNDGGKTYPYGFFLTGDLIAKILYAHGINADYIDTGALTVRDSDGNIIFQVDMDTKKVIISGDNVVIGDSSLPDKLTKMDNNIASAKNMTFQLSNDMQTITSDADGNIPVFPTVATTAKVMYGSSDITNDCSYTITKSDSVTGSWDVNTHTYTVTGLIADNGWVDIKATYLQTLSITRRFTIAKLKAGKNGVNGLDGLQGEKGEQGVPGKDGKDGTNGVDGKTSYFHIKYSSVANPTSSSQMTETPSTYIGTYVDYEPNDSTDPKKYTWSKFEGSDGKDGIAGTNGTDGKTYYLHIAYANSADGKTGFSVSDGTNKLYIGQYTDTTKTDSTDPTKYTWSKIKGETGADGKPGRTYIIEPSCNVLKRGSDKVISPNFITFKAYYRDGDSAARVPYKGRFIVEETVDGSAWKTIYISSTDEDTVTHYLYSILTNSSGQAVASSNGSTIGIPRDVTNVRCKLYASGGTTTLMDMQSVAVVIDIDNLTQEQIVSILTNDGAWKGLYYSNGRLYVSLDALLGGTVTLGGKKNGNGYLKIKDASNAVKGLIDRSGYTVFTSYEENSEYMKYTGVQFSSDGIFPVDIKKFFGDEVDIEIENSENWGISWDDNSLTVHATEVSADTGTFENLTVTNPASFAKSPKIEDMEYTTSSNTVCWDGRTGYKQLMLKSSSSKRYKDIGSDISEQEIEEWYNIEPTWAKYKKGYLVKGDENEGRYIPMFIAENVEAFFPEATRHQNGLVEDWNERIMIPAMFAMIKSQKEQLDRQEKLINQLYEKFNIEKEN
nr:MAG TPA: tail protein [Caudoviricetes sp.]